MTDQERILSALDHMADPDEYRRVYAEPSDKPCQVDGCVLSQQEHHRLAYGMLAELRELREYKRMTVGSAP